MANLKLDLLNKLKNDKYYEELKLVRLAQDPNMDYKEKINDMSVALENLVLLNSQMGLVEQYFNEEPAQAPAVAPTPTPADQAPAPTTEPVVEKPAAKVHQNQSHSEG
jgi:hypothetical protein